MSGVIFAAYKQFKQLLFFSLIKDFKRTFDLEYESMYELHDGCCVALPTD